MYRTLFHNSNDAIFVHQPIRGNEPGYFIEVNQTACLRYGYSKEEFLKMTPMELDDTGYSTKVPERIRLLCDQKYIVFETVHRAKNGKPLPVEISSHLFSLKGKPTIISIARDIAERKRQERELIRQHEEIRQLVNQLSEVEETERQRIAGELHDLAGQNLTSLSINLNLIDRLLTPDAPQIVRERLQECLSIVEQTSTSIRSVMADLRPPVLDDYGLTAALKWYSEQYSRRTGIEVDLTLEDFPVRFPVHVELSLFRIIQEAMTNVMKHAGVSWLALTQKVDTNRLVLSVTDKGVGFKETDANVISKNGGWGFGTMRERALAVDAMIRIDSHAGKGTAVTVTKALMVSE